MEPLSMNGVSQVKQPTTSLYHLPQYSSLHTQGVEALATIVGSTPSLPVQASNVLTNTLPVLTLDTSVGIQDEVTDQLVDVKPFPTGAVTSPTKDSPLDASTEELAQVSNQILNPSNLLRQINQLGPSERCSPTQAHSMGKQLLTIIAYHEKNNVSLPVELQSSFDILHRCLAVIYGTFFLNLYTKANAPCLLCHSCKCLYPPGQFIHHTCSSLPPNMVPCRSRMWRRCLVPLVSPGVDKDMQKQRWKYVLEKFSHNAAIASRKHLMSSETESQLLDMPELKRGRFMSKQTQPRKSSDGETTTDADKNENVNGTVDANVLDIESADYNLDDSSPIDAVHSPSSLSTSPIVLAEQVVSEMRRLYKDLALAKIKLNSATELIGRMPSEACMREQLAQALSSQQILTLERDQAREQARVAVERAEKLQKQLDLLRQAHAQMEKHLSS